MAALQTKIAIGTRVIYKYPLTDCHRDGQFAIVRKHGEETKAGLPHLIEFENDKETMMVFPDEITPVAKK